MDLSEWTWGRLNREVMVMDEKRCLALFEAEKAGLRRGFFLRRIQSRINKLRREREALEITRLSGE